MMFHARVEVRLKPGHSDPEGDTTRRSLVDLAYDVVEVRTAKVYEVTFHADDRGTAAETIEEMCVRLLANPIKDDFQCEVEEIR
jgi:phosphoribosylformylglycinamidine synthase